MAGTLSKKRRVFIASTGYDLGIIRREICKFIKELGYEPVAYEHFLKVKDYRYKCDPLKMDECIDKVKDCAYFMLIVGIRAGALYQGTKKKIFKGKTITHCEAITAIRGQLNFRWYTTQDIWDERKRYNAHLKSSRREKRFWFDAVNQKDGPTIYNFTNYLQEYKRQRHFDYNDLSELKENIGLWLDPVAYFILEKRNAAFIQVRDLKEALNTVYSKHTGEIWLFNNDLGVFLDNYQFKQLYEEVFLRNTHITKVKLVLSQEKYKQFTNISSKQKELLTNFSLVKSRIKDFLIAKLEDFKDIPKPLLHFNLIIYAVDRHLSNPDTVFQVRPHFKPFSKDSQELTDEDFLIMFNNVDNDTLAGRIREIFTPIFQTESTFNRLGFELRKGKPINFKLFK